MYDDSGSADKNANTILKSDFLFSDSYFVCSMLVFLVRAINHDKKDFLIVDPAGK